MIFDLFQGVLNEVVKRWRIQPSWPYCWSTVWLYYICISCIILATISYSSQSNKGLRVLHNTQIHSNFGYPNPKIIDNLQIRKKVKAYRDKRRLHTMSPMIYPLDPNRPPNETSINPQIKKVSQTIILPWQKMFPVSWSRWSTFLMYKTWAIVPWSSVFYVCQTDKTVIKHLFSVECITPHFLLEKNYFTLIYYVQVAHKCQKTKHIN